MLRHLLKTPFRQSALVAQPARFFRPGTVNPYKHDPTPVSPKQREAQELLPVWDRVFDHQKYMKHNGALKVSILLKFT